MELKDYEFYHVIQLPDGRLTPGIADHRDQPKLLGIDGPGLLHGRRVLDVGANDGFWSFWAEQAGATDVLATDVDSYEEYDWAYSGPPADIGKYGQQQKRATFDALKKFLNSRVRRERKTVYALSPETDGVFDVVVFYGVLYHLRHPLLALDKLRRVCSGCVLIETHVATRHSFVPSALFYWDDVFHGSTNWCGPTESCVVAWMRSAGFSTIFRQKISPTPGETRQRFIGTVTDDWRKVFERNDNFAVADDAYFARVRQETREHLAMQP